MAGDSVEAGDEDNRVDEAGPWGIKVGDDWQLLPRKPSQVAQSSRRACLSADVLVLNGTK